MLVYEENPVRRRSGAFDPSKYDATSQWLTHYQNLLTLEFFARNGTRDERVQAERELAVARRKLDFWKRQARWNESNAIAGKNALDRQWKR